MEKLFIDSLLEGSLEKIKDNPLIGLSYSLGQAILKISQLEEKINKKNERINELKNELDNQDDSELFNLQDLLREERQINILLKDRIKELENNLDFEKTIVSNQKMQINEIHEKFLKQKEKINELKIIIKKNESDLENNNIFYINLLEKQRELLEQKNIEIENLKEKVKV